MRSIDIARRARRIGFYMHGTDIWVHCPRCRDQVHGHWDTATRQVRTMTQELDRAMVEHLSNECEVTA